MKRKLRVYYAPLADGVYSYMVAAFTKHEACKLMGISTSYFRSIGGFVRDESYVNAHAINNPGKVWRKKVKCFGFHEWEIVE